MPEDCGSSDRRARRSRETYAKPSGEAIVVDRTMADAEAGHRAPPGSTRQDERVECRRAYDARTRSRVEELRLGHLGEELLELGLVGGRDRVSSTGAPTASSRGGRRRLRIGGRCVLSTVSGPSCTKAATLVAKRSSSTKWTHGLSTLPHSSWPAATSSASTSATSSASAPSGDANGAPKQSELKSTFCFGSKKRDRARVVEQRRSRSRAACGHRCRRCCRRARGTSAPAGSVRLPTLITPMVTKLAIDPGVGRSGEQSHQGSGVVAVARGSGRSTAAPPGR